MVLDIVVGGVTNHVATTPLRLRPTMIAKMDAFAESLVDILLRGIGQPTARSPGDNLLPVAPGDGPQPSPIPSLQEHTQP
jgi:hypothetical protein